MRPEFVTVSSRKLRAALTLCDSVVERRATYPVLGMARLTIGGGKLLVSATDMDIDLTVEVAAEAAQGDWSICLPVRPLEAIARLGGNETLTIERQATTHGDVDARAAVVTLDQADLFDAQAFMIEGLGPDTFPAMAGRPGTLVERFGNGGLGVLLRRVSWATSREETRYYLCGVAWEIGPRGRRVVATDGHRLAICHYDRVPAPATNETATRVLPSKLVGLLQQLGAETVTISTVLRNDGETDPFKIDIDCGDGQTIRAKLIEMSDTTRYPDVDRVIPRAELFKATIAVSADRLSAGLDRALVFSTRYGGYAIKLDGAAGKLRLGTTHADGGAASVTLPVPWPETAEAFGVNGHYLKDMLRHCDGDLTLHQVDAGAPLTVFDSDETMTRLIMPMRV